MQTQDRARNRNRLNTQGPLRNQGKVSSMIISETFVGGHQFMDYLWWGIFGLIMIYALRSGFVWAIAWNLLFGCVIIIRKHIASAYHMIIEFIFLHWMISYSVTVIYLSNRDGTYDLIHDSGIQSALWPPFYGMLTLLLGIIIFFILKKKNSSKNLNLEIEITESEAVKMCVVGCLSDIILVPMSPGSLRIIFIVIGYCTPIGLTLVAYRNVKLGRSWLFTTKGVIWSFACIFWFLHSVSGGLFGGTMVVVLVLAAQFIQKSKALPVLFVVACLVIAPLFQDIKGDLRSKDNLLVASEQYRERSVLSVFSSNFEKTFVHGNTNVYLDGITELAYRMCTFDTWNRVYQHMNYHNDYAKGETILNACVTSLIPRVFWRDKPDTGGVNTLAEKYADMNVYFGTSVSVGLISEFYINGGEIIVVLGMLIIGVLIGYVLYLGTSTMVQPLGYFMAISIVAAVLRPEVSLADLLGGCFRTAFLWYVLNRWLSKRHLESMRRNLR